MDTNEERQKVISNLALRSTELVEAWIADYEFDDGESFHHTPTKGQLVLIQDAVAGLLGEREILDALVDWQIAVRSSAAISNAAVDAELDAELEEIARILKTTADECASSDDSHGWFVLQRAENMVRSRIGQPAPHGFVSVPAEPTDEMEKAYFTSIDKHMKRVETGAMFGRYGNFRIAYKAMLSAAPSSIGQPVRAEQFQSRVHPWMLECFGDEVASDTVERNHRFLEESLELVQACGCTANEAHQLVDYVFGRQTGELDQEVGGVMVTLAALCLAQNTDMHTAGEKELARVWTKIEQIRSKQAGKPKHSPLPQAVGQSVRDPVRDELVEALMKIRDATHACGYGPGWVAYGIAVDTLNSYSELAKQSSVIDSARDEFVAALKKEVTKEFTFIGAESMTGFQALAVVTDALAKLGKEEG